MQKAGPSLTLQRFRPGIALAILGLSVLNSHRALAFNNHQPFDISADMIDYVEADQSMIAEGHVVVVQGSSSTLKADHMIYQRQAKKLFASGHVFMQDNGQTMLGDRLNYDLALESGTVTNALGFMAPWLFSGADWEKRLDYYVGHQMNFTSCDLADPHYHFRSHSVHLVPDNYFWAWNNVAFVGDVPMFYSPFMYKNLAKRRVVIQFQPGHDDVNGEFVKTLTTVRFTDLIYDKVLFDHYSLQGNGIGNEFDYQQPGKVQGSLFGYYIHPHGDPALSGSLDIPQYSLRSYHWQHLDNYDTLQSNINLRKNVSFNSLYFPQDPNGSQTDIISSLAVTRQKGKFNQQLVVQREDAPDNTSDPFAETHIQSAQYPSYRATMYQIPLWTPYKQQVSSGVWVSTGIGYTSQKVWVPNGSLIPGTTTVVQPRPILSSGQHATPLSVSANANFTNNYQRLDQGYHPVGQGAFTLTQSFPLSRDWSFTPTLTPELDWQDRYDAQPLNTSTTPLSTAGLFKGYQGVISQGDTLRWRPVSSLTMDSGYSIAYRLEPNGLGLDRYHADGGIGSNHLSESAYWRPNRTWLLQSQSGYDLRKIADEAPDLYNQRKWDPWTSKLQYQHGLDTEVLIDYQEYHYPERAQLWDINYTHRGRYKTLWQTGLLYNRGSAGFLTWNNTVGLYLSPGWRIDGTVNSQFPNTSLHDALNGGNLLSETILLTRDMHCWQASFVYRNIPPYTKQYGITFDLKLGVKAQEQINNNDLETQYYPWRARPYAQ